MSRDRALACAAVLAWSVAGCSSQTTGVHVNVHLGSIAYDELRFGVAVVDADGGPSVTLVDPDTAGSKTGLSGAGDQDIVILLDDDLGGREIFCDVAALRAGVLTGSGDNAVLAQTHRIRDVDIFMEGAAPDDGGANGDAAADTGEGPDDANGSGGTGAGGGNGSGGTNGSGGANGDAGRSDTRIDAGAGTGGAGGSGVGGAGGSTAGTGALGTPCTTKGQCASLFCVDGVCCESACATACTSCNLNGLGGRCRQVANRATDPHGICVDKGAASCGTNGTCDNTGACARYPFGTACPPACADAQDRFGAGICSLAETCVGIGARVACPAPARSCVAGACR